MDVSDSSSSLRWVESWDPTLSLGTFLPFSLLTTLIHDAIGFGFGFPRVGCVLVEDLLDGMLLELPFPPPASTIKLSSGDPGVSLISLAAFLELPTVVAALEAFGSLLFGVGISLVDLLLLSEFMMS